LANLGDVADTCTNIQQVAEEAEEEEEEEEEEDTPYWLDLETLGSQPITFENLSGH
jgi:hypothetical protein